MIAAANFTYLIGICMPNIAALAVAPRPARRRAPLSRAARHHRARRCRRLRLADRRPCSASSSSACRPSLFGLALAYSGAALYAWRVIEDRERQGLPAFAQHAARQAHRRHAVRAGARRRSPICWPSTRSRTSTRALVSVLADIFVVVALLTISVGLVLAGHDHLLGAGGERGRQAPDVGHAARVLARHGGARPRRSAMPRMLRSTSCR